MKKLKKLKINKLQGFTCIEAEEQMMMKGGYTQSQMESMMNNGTWTGGQVDGMGYVAAGVTVYGGGNILPYVNMVYGNSHDNEISGIIEAGMNAAGMVWNGFAWVYNRVAN